jgi:ribonuclease HI
MDQFTDDISTQTVINEIRAQASQALELMQSVIQKCDDIDSHIHQINTFSRESGVRLASNVGCNLTRSITNGIIYTIAWTDGSALYSQGSSILFYGCGVFWGSNNVNNISQPFYKCKCISICEVWSIYCCLKKAVQMNIMNLRIMTDSLGAQKLVSSILLNHVAANSLTAQAISQSSLLNMALQGIRNLAHNFSHIQISWIKAHTQAKDIFSKGNEQADALARAAAKLCCQMEMDIPEEANVDFEIAYPETSDVYLDYASTLNQTPPPDQAELFDKTFSMIGMQRGELEDYGSRRREDILTTVVKPNSLRAVQSATRTVGPEGESLIQISEKTKPNQTKTQDHGTSQTDLSPWAKAYIPISQRK